MSKLYFCEAIDDLRCMGLATIRQYMKEHGVKRIEITEARRITGEGYFFCKEFQDIGESRDGCGILCDKYKPNNGKNGRCKHYGYCYEPTDKTRIIKS